jgi:hypothetical protein
MIRETTSVLEFRRKNNEWNENESTLYKKNVTDCVDRGWKLGKLGKLGICDG